MSAPRRRRKGRQAGDPLTLRSESVRLMMRPGEWDDLEAIADAWRVPVATAGWAIVADYLGRLRGVRADLAEAGIGIAAAQRIGRQISRSSELGDPVELEADDLAADPEELGDLAGDLEELEPVAGDELGDPAAGGDPELEAGGQVEELAELGAGGDLEELAADPEEPEAGGVILSELEPDELQRDPVGR